MGRDELQEIRELIFRAEVTSKARRVGKIKRRNIQMNQRKEKECTEEKINDDDNKDEARW